jgi:hypothetical protein
MQFDTGSVSRDGHFRARLQESKLGGLRRKGAPQRPLTFGTSDMTAIAEPLDVTAERGGATTLDRNHGMPQRGGQRRGVLVTERRVEVAEQGQPIL